MSSMKLYQLGAIPVLAAALPLFASTGCGDAAALIGVECEASFAAKATSLQGACTALVDGAGSIKADVALACYNIATDLGDDTLTEPGADVADDEVTTLCNAASASLSVAIEAAGGIEIAINGGGCEVNADAQFSCEASCDVSGGCDPGSIEVRCDPGELSVSCEGSCEANAYCEGSATVEANCEGSCEGTCTGTCEGNCEGTCEGTQSSGSCAGTCEGKCSAKCTGSCKGSCQLAADASIDCGANVKCKGGCNGTATLPSCEAELEPPSCNIDAECSAGCNGQATITAECTPPSIEIYVDGHADLVATLETNLPDIFAIFQFKGELMVDAAVEVANLFVDVAGAVVADAGCVLIFGADLVASATGSLAASASVSVSVSASASVGGEASGG